MPPSLISYMRKLNKIIEENESNDVMDLSAYNFLAPPLLLPLLQYMEQHNLYEYYPNPNTEPYLRKVLGKEKHTGTTIPLRPLKNFEYINYFNKSDEIENYLSDLTDEIIDLSKLDVDRNGGCLVLYELLTNIYKHSKCTRSYILCQKYPNIDKADVCIIDDGVSIPGSLEESGLYYGSDSEAIFRAINCTTTDKEEDNVHGRGLNTSANITSLAFGEELLIASREGVCTVRKNRIKLWNNDMPFIDGTFIALRINTNKIKNISEYTRKHTYTKM